MPPVGKVINHRSQNREFKTEAVARYKGAIQALAAVLLPNVSSEEAVRTSQLFMYRPEGGCRTQVTLVSTLLGGLGLYSFEFANNHSGEPIMGAEVNVQLQEKGGVSPELLGTLANLATFTQEDMKPEFWMNLHSSASAEVEPASEQGLPAFELRAA